MMRILWSLFLTGVVLGSGPCLFSCGPLLISYITATKDDAKSGFVTYLIFSLTRVFVYVILGALCGILGEAVLRGFFESSVLKTLFVVFGFFLISCGLLLVLEKFSFGRHCRGFVHKHFGRSDIKSVILFSLAVSLAPCLPLLAVLGYVALISDHWLKGIFYMAAFGLGTAISPLLIFSVAAGYMVHLLQTKVRVLRVLKIICGIIICFLGIHLLYLSLVRP